MVDRNPSAVDPTERICGSILDTIGNTPLVHHSGHCYRRADTRKNGHCTPLRRRSKGVPPDSDHAGVDVR